MREELRLLCDPDHLRSLRESLGLSQADVAAQLGFEQDSMYQDIESHEDELGSVFSLAQVKELAKLFGESHLDWWGLPISDRSRPKHELIYEARLSKGWNLKEFEEASGWHDWALERAEVSDDYLEREFPANGIGEISVSLGIPLSHLLD